MTFDKVLWAEDLPNIEALAVRAQAIGAKTVAVRTTANNFHDSIPTFHRLGMKIWGWRYPPIDRDRAIEQAREVVGLLRLGLDGFIVDPEGSDSNYDDWNRHDLASLALDYCRTIRDPFPAAFFGVTSDHRAGRVYPLLPWSTFIGQSDKVFPQAYWRMQTDSGPEKVGTGEPAQNYDIAFNSWKAVGAAEGIVIPMAGEIALAKPAEIAAYAAAAHDHGVTELHFYAMNDEVDDAVWRAIAAL